ncbi:MAG: F0F1 ATP synthase subunit delta [Clostridium sp.]
MKVKNSLFVICTVILCSIITTGCGAVKQEKGVKVEKEVKEVKEENNYVLEIKNGERFFKSEFVPKSNSEKVILDYFKMQISDEYDNFKNILIDSEQYTYYPETYKKQFNEGLYTEEITVHSLSALNEDEYTNETNGLKYYSYMERLKKYNPSKFEIIEVNYTIKLTDEYNKIAQWGSGDWIRYFVVVKEKEDSDWKIFDIYGYM